MSTAFLRTKLRETICFCVIGFWLTMALPVFAAPFPGMGYCSVPPVAATGVKPNLLLMLDNSASTYDLAYVDPAGYCVDDSYDNARSYPGYFEQQSTYTYSVSGQKFILSEQSLPASCNTASTPFVCVNMTPSDKVDSFVAKGKFLNWLSMSKLDLQKQALTGGKFMPDPNGVSGTMVAQSRGCMGNRFVKLAPGAPRVTFAVRGPAVGDDDYWYGLYGGGTWIEIYKRTYNKESCLKAVHDWLDGGSLASLREDASACVGAAYLFDDDGVTPSKMKTSIDIISKCYENPNDVVTSDKTVVNDCLARLARYYDGSGEYVPMGIGDDVCAAAVPHGITLGDYGQVVNFGFLGACMQYFGNDEVCSEREAQEYCRELVSRQLIDPTVGNSPRSNANVPSFILDAGIYTVSEVSGRFRARVAVASAPTGLVQQYADDINFAAMVFNDNGVSPFECRVEDVDVSHGGFVYGDIPCPKRCTGPDYGDQGKPCSLDGDCINFCEPLSSRDGGRIVSGIGAPLGDHSCGLIAAIDGIEARSWTPLGEAFYNAIGYFAGRSDLRLNPDDFAVTGFPAAYSCQRNHVLIVSDGASWADRNAAVCRLVADAARDWAADARDPMPAGMTTQPADASPPFGGSYNIDDLAWIARHRNITSFAAEITGNRDYISTHVLYTGPSCGDYLPGGACRTSDEAIPEKLMQLTAAKGGGGIANASSPAELGEAFRKLLQQIASGSGTDAAIVSTGDGNGAMFLMERFFPSKSFDAGATSVSWVGEMEGLWYYIDPFIGSAGAGSTIREDSDPGGAGNVRTLDVKKDRAVGFRSVTEAGNARTYAYRLEDGVETRVEIDDLSALWRAGRQLWSRDLTVSPRTIYTTSLGVESEVPGTGLMRLSAAAPDAVAPYLDLKAGDPAAARLISYLHGFDFPGDAGMRSRTVEIAGTPASAAAPRDTGVGVWKLGDIVSSTPQVQSRTALGAYHLPPPRGYGDAGYASFVGRSSYKGRGMVYVGANDGMLHAFRLGSLDTNPSTLINGDVKASLAAPEGGEPGSEAWAFVPKDALPYLKYLADPRYRHLFLVDGRLTLVDASIGASGSCSPSSYWTCTRSAASWRSVLIGGMGLGGASCSAGSECVPPPLTDPADGTKKVGRSSYFALDVTDPEHPVLLWEFRNPQLGYATTGPAVMRVGDRNLNGRWFAVFGSGPTGPVDSVKHQFLGRSGQQLQLFVVDLFTGELLATLPTGVDNAFAGSLSGGAIDADRWDGSYQDDALYVGYTRADSDTVRADTRWNAGGVLRVLTAESRDPVQWRVSKVIDGIGPVTAGIARLQDRKNHELWLFFGTGRYFFPGDDMEGRRTLYGVKEPCYNVRSHGVVVQQDRMEKICSAAVSVGALSDQTTEHPFAPSDPGWLIDLEAAGGAGAERLVTAPTSVTGGAVYFSTFRPSGDPCRYGDSFLWQVRYDTGGSVGGAVQGKLLVQSPTGDVAEGTLAGNAQRRGAAGPGPGRPLPVTNSGLRPLRRIIHIQER